MNTLFRFTLLSLTLISLGLLTTHCSDEDPAEFKVNPEFTKHISAFSSGVISAHSTIEIELVKPYGKPITPNKAIDEELFDFSPGVEGKTVWLDQNTISFIPKSPLESGETYWVEFNLGAVADVSGELETFKFPITIIKQALSFEADGLISYDNENIEWQQFRGKVITADKISTEQLNETFTIKQGGKTYNAKWERKASDRIYTMIVDSVKRKKSAEDLEITWEGDNISAEGSGNDKVEVPAIGDFKITSYKVIQHPEQHVLVRFSDPLSTEQDIDGLVEIKDHSGLRTAVSTNELRIYPNARLTGDKTVIIHDAIKNCKGYKYGREEHISVKFEAIKPMIKLVGEGTILPSSNGMVVPFEAVNLKAVDVRIIKIYENNISQFFQNNNYDGDRELKRVGRVIRKKTIHLGEKKPVDYSVWNRFNLDLSEYIKVDQGAIYRVQFSFRKHQSTYPCSGELNEDIQMDEEDWDEYDNAEEEKWNYVSDYSYGYYYSDYFRGYDYRERENPCSYSYYRGKSFTKNVFASDIGIIAKKGTNGELIVATSNIVDTKPIIGASVKVFDYQQQLIATVDTDGEGIARTEKLEKEPFFIEVSDGTNKGYLRLNDGASLPLSRFDVGGATIQEGIKGFIYGERGVWRPGDTLFLTYMLEDKEDLIPENHPVIYELFDPRGQLYKRSVLKSGVNGFYDLTTPTQKDVPTGNWRVKVKVGGATFYKTVKVESIKPNRLKVNLNLDEKILGADQDLITGELDVKWLHGAPARGLKTDVSVTFVQASTAFENFKKYVFDDPSKSFNSSEEKIFEGTLNDEGKTRFSADIAAHKQAPGMLKAVFKTRAFEKGGDFSVNQQVMPYAPFTKFVGVKSPTLSKYGALQTDSTYKFDIVSVDKHGQPSSSSNITIEVYRISWSWWWERGRNNLASYIGRSNIQPVSKERISTGRNGKGTAKVRINKYDWGRYLIRVTDENSGHSTGLMTYFDWPSWMSRSGRKTPDGANMLVFASDKEEYQTGDKAKISFPSSKGGRALISIEDGKKVKDAFWIQTEGSETSFELPITPDLAPNCYVHITLLQPHKQTKNDAPIRMYGVIPILVTDPETILKPVIKMPDELAPESSYTLSVSEENGKAMTYTVAVVDEGLLDLTNFATPDPWQHFYSREALGVKTWDLYDHVIGAYGAKVENLLTIGGDASLDKGDDSAIRFKPMVRFLGPFKLSAGSTAKHKISIPNYIGSVRTMVIAGQDGAYGNAEKATPVKKPLMALATLPRVLSPNEIVNLPVTIFAMEDKVKDVKVQVKTNSLLNVQGGSVQNIHFDRVGDKVVNFSIKVPQKIGKATVEVIATGAGEKSTYDIELDVRNPNLPVTDVFEAVVDAGESWSTEMSFPGMPGTNEAMLEVSTIPPIDLEKRLQYLIRYPHGCIEQTTSKAFPQLYLKTFVEMDADAKSSIQRNVTAAINKIRRHQHASGGFAYWSGSRSTSDWGTTYAGHFLLEAEKQGYALPYGVKEKWIDYQRSQARKWNTRNENGYKNNELAQAYRLYTLALAGKPVKSAMNRLREVRGLSISAAWRLALAYQIIGKSNVASEIVRDKATRITPYNELGYTYGSHFRDQAMIIETLTKMGRKNEAAGLVKDLSEALSSNRWMSTQTTAFSLKSIAEFVGKQPKNDGISYSYSFNGKSGSPKSNQVIHQSDLKVSGGAGKTLSFKNKSKSLMYVRVVRTGIPLAGDEVSKEENLGMNVVYKNMDGQVISVEELSQGTDFVAEVTVRNPGYRGYYNELALTQLFPSGWEIRNQRMELSGSTLSNDYYEYQDIRDDRVLTYFDLSRNSSKTFTIGLHAAYIGEYYLPAVRCEAMYDASISALKKGRKIKVVQPGK
tara:strand:- start:38658 stop:44237 length:5580 start_codon:yes stop_codon:yes gene_type:complete